MTDRATSLAKIVAREKWQERCDTAKDCCACGACIVATLSTCGCGIISTSMMLSKYFDTEKIKRTQRKALHAQLLVKHQP